MKTKHVYLLFLSLTGFAMLAAFQNCSQTNFSKSKERVLASTSIFSTASDTLNQDLPVSPITVLQNGTTVDIPVNNTQQSPATVVDVPVNNTQQSPATVVDVPVNNTQQSPATVVDVPVNNTQQPPANVADVPVNNTQHPPATVVDVPVNNTQPVQPTCDSGKVLVNGVCQTVVCTQNRTSQINSGTCIETCINQGTAYGAKSCSCATGLSYNAGTNSCGCADSTQVLVAGQCVSIKPGTVMFGGSYQCFDKTSAGMNYLNAGVVATASEVQLVILEGEVVKGQNATAKVLYQTNKAASGKSLKQEILDSSGYASVVIPNNISGKVSAIFYDPSYSTVNSNKYTSPSSTEYYVTRAVTRSFSYGYAGTDFNSGELQAYGKRAAPQFEEMTFVLNWAESGDQRCLNHVSSPLIVDMRKEIKKGSKGISLTSQANGILFDIMGKNSSPIAHTKKQISWLNDSRAFMFLTLPDKNGLVQGIDQLFGDNTTGPDGQFAQNGYLALGKYDLNKDNVIDKKDPIFQKLRLWSDLNKNGVAEQDELFSLDEVGLVEIDLKYDKNYKETDKYGNITAMRSVVKFKNGALRLIFDLWFKHKD